MSFLTYEETRPWAAAIREAVLTKRMPPWFAEQGVGPAFHNDRTMSPREQEVLSTWAETGSAAGDPTKAPPPQAFVDGWNIEPDQVMTVPTYEVPADGVVEYTYYIVKNPFPEDRWVRMMELRPSNRSLVHHLVVSLRPPGSNFLKDYPAGEFFTADRETRNIGSEEQGGSVGFDFRQFMAAYVPGYNVAEQYTGEIRDRAVLIPAGSDLVFELHYTTTGTAGADQPSLGLVFADEPPAVRALSGAVANVKFVIPPKRPQLPSRGGFHRVSRCDPRRVEPAHALPRQGLRVPRRFPRRPSPNPAESSAIRL